jgi:peptidoglycan/LPS O-acetylase OafA/YrhL
MVPQDTKVKIGTIGALRGFAAVAVCWYHFTYGQSPALKWTGQYGWLGVHVFFVISGFIIPFSLYQHRYEMRDYFRFVGKRLARLHPPYLASIAVAVTLSGVTYALFPYAHISLIQVSFGQLFWHFFYLNDLIGQPWLNVAYWTLSIELQWYLLLGLTFLLLASRRWYIQLGGALLMLLGYRLAPSEHMVFHSLPIFLIGVFVFQYRVGLSSLWRMLLSIAAMFALMKTPIGLPVAIVSSITGLLIAFIAVENRWCNRLGEVSYSLYLLHIPVGLMLLAILTRLPYSGSFLALIDTVVLAGCFAASSIFYRYVEEPSQKWSSAIKMKRARKASQEKLLPAAATAD